MEVMAKPLPSFIKRLQVLGNSRIDLGAKILSVFEIDDEKVKEGIIELTRFYVQFNDIKGFTFEIEAMLTPEESIPLLGITMP
jgi:hypothetical protein